MTGPAPFAGVYFNDLKPAGTNLIFDSGPGNNIQIFFANDLPSSGTDPLSTIKWSNGFPPVIDNAPSGQVCGFARSTAVPEPASLTLLAAALGLLLVSRAKAR